MATWYQLFNLFVIIIAFAAAVAAVWVGYWMGRNSSNLPLRSTNNPKLTNQGSGEEPGGDPFVEAMELPTLDNEDDRIDTMRPK